MIDYSACLGLKLFVVLNLQETDISFIHVDKPLFLRCIKSK